MKTVVIFLDTVRKDMLSIYNKDTDVKTPNISLLAEDCNIFDSHNTGSLPCMPARRDFFTGRLDFFDRPWGALEPFDRVLSKELSINGISSHIITDHAHYWRHGGENYLQYFDTFIMNRGQESDPYISYIDEYEIPKNIHGRYNLQFYKNFNYIKNIDDYPTSMTFNKACEFLKNNKNEDNFYLQIEGFDPHEPFAAPEEFYKMYDVDDNIYYNSPIYGENNDSEQNLSELRKRYKSTLSFADYNVGKVLQTLKELGIYDECNIIFTTDHGFQLGEHDFLGKGMTHIYNEICEIPLLHKLPDQRYSKRFNQFTQNIDIMPTLLEMYDIKGDFNFHGKSYLNLIKGGEYNERECIITGYFGQSITYKNKEYTYLKPKIKSVEEHVLTAVPRIMYGYMGSKYTEDTVDYENIKNGKYLNFTNYPVYNFTTSFIHKGCKCEVYKLSDKEQKRNINSEDIEIKLDIELKKVLSNYNTNDYYINTFNFKD